MTPNTRSQLEAITRDLDRWLRAHNSLFIAGIRNKIMEILNENDGPKGTVSPCERVSYEKCLDRIDEQIKYLKGQVSHDAWGPKYTEDQAKEIKDLKASRKEIVTKLGLPI